VYVSGVYEVYATGDVGAGVCAVLRCEGVGVDVGECGGGSLGMILGEGCLGDGVWIMGALLIK